MEFSQQRLQRESQRLVEIVEAGPGPQFCATLASQGPPLPGLVLRLRWHIAYARGSDIDRLQTTAHAAFRCVAIAVSVQRVLGKLAAHLGEWRSAFSHFEEALGSLSAGGASWELILAYQDYAEARRSRARRGDDLKASALDAQANDLLRGLGLPNPSPRSRVRSSLRFGLSVREMQVIRLISEGKRNREIAVELGLSIGTIERHIENILRKMQVENRAQAVMEAARSGILAH